VLRAVPWRGCGSGRQLYSCCLETEQRLMRLQLLC
jgi:hypothetical protein